LRPEELRAKPLRPGLSAVVRIDTSHPGRSVLQPLTTTPEAAYKTEVYDRQLDGADALIDKIIEANRRQARQSDKPVATRHS
jgi:membrane fusion protein (multidrug efflux system)